MKLRTCCPDHRWGDALNFGARMLAFMAAPLTVANLHLSVVCVAVALQFYMASQRLLRAAAEVVQVWV